MASISRLPQPLMEAYEWQFEGACQGADPEIFFSPESERGPRRRAREAKAKAYCSACPVVRTCLEHALKVKEPYGVWGGMTTGERAQLLADPHRAAS